MSELTYGIDNGLIALALLASMATAIELGFRIGLRRKYRVNEAARTHVNGVQASILGILALLLGFSFSVSLQRFDSRSESVVAESNAIGTTYLRSQLLPVAVRVEVQAGLRQYVDLRVQTNELSLIDQARRESLLAEAGRLQMVLWAYARQAAEAVPNPVTSGLFIQSLNDLIDTYGKLNAEMDRHVPELVLMNLYGTLLMAGAIVGFSSGIADHRPFVASYIMVGLIVVVVVVTLDLDRPRRGLIRVSQKSLLELQASIHREMATVAAIPRRQARPAAEAGTLP